MGLLDKMKNLFTEEVDEPVEKKKTTKKPKEEIKKEIFKEERTVEIAPARKETVEYFEHEEKAKEEKTEVKEEKHSLPIFSDDDFLDLPKREEKTKITPKQVLKSIYPDKKENTNKEEKKSFKPSPIISPVYGILDKNYKKDEISAKVVTNPYKSDKVTVDDIRNKAFGTLEDELESNLLDNHDNIEPKEDLGIDIFDELQKEEKNNITEELEKQKQQIEEINEIIKTNVNPEDKKVTSRKIDNILEELDEIEELIPNKDKKEEKNDDLEEGDLFNLIDSMYEKRDE